MWLLVREFEYLITDVNGIHAIPACKLAVEARKFQSRITIRAGGREAQLQELIEVMGLNIKQGHRILVRAEGKDENDAICHMEKIFNQEL